jgi:hypothetical protein
MHSISELMLSTTASEGYRDGVGLTTTRKRLRAMRNALSTSGVEVWMKIPLLHDQVGQHNVSR